MRAQFFIIKSKDELSKTRKTVLLLADPRKVKDLPLIQLFEIDYISSYREAYALRQRIQDKITLSLSISQQFINEPDLEEPLIRFAIKGALTGERDSFKRRLFEVIDELSEVLPELKIIYSYE